MRSRIPETGEDRPAVVPVIVERRKVARLVATEYQPVGVDDTF